MNINELNSLINFYQQKTDEQQKSLYNSITLDKNGINYNNWFKLFHKASDNIKYIDAEGFYLMFTIICHNHTQNRKYLQISLSALLENSVFKDVRTIKKYLEKLIKYNLIYIKDYSSSMNKNTLMDIIILYNESVEGFKPIPIDFFNRCLRFLSPLQTSIVLTLIEKFKFFDCYNYIDDDTGEIIYTYIDCEYAFPTLTNLSKILKYDRHVISQNIRTLAHKGIISYTVLNNKPFWSVTREGYKMKNPNYRYRVKLLQRLEYNYYLIKKFDYFDSRKNDTIITSRQNMDKILRSPHYNNIKPNDWVNVRYNNTYFSYFQKALKDKDCNYYKENKENNLLLMENFNNKNL